MKRAKQVRKKTNKRHNGTLTCAHLPLMTHAHLNDTGLASLMSTYNKRSSLWALAFSLSLFFVLFFFIFKGTLNIIIKPKDSICINGAINSASKLKEDNFIDVTFEVNGNH